MPVSFCGRGANCQECAVWSWVEGGLHPFLAMQITVGRQSCLTSVCCIYFAVFHLVVLLIKSHFFKKNKWPIAVIIHNVYYSNEAK